MNLFTKIALSLLIENGSVTLEEVARELYEKEHPDATPESDMEAPITQYIESNKRPARSSRKRAPVVKPGTPGYNKLALGAPLRHPWAKDFIIAAAKLRLSGVHWVEFCNRICALLPHGSRSEGSIRRYCGYYTHQIEGLVLSAKAIPVEIHPSSLESYCGAWIDHYLGSWEPGRK